MADMGDILPPSGVNYHYNSMPLAMPARAVTRKFRPQTTNSFQYSSGQRVIRIPLTSSGFMDPMHSYLRFKLRSIKTGGTAERVLVDGAVSSIINRLRIEGSDGAELERIENYNVLAAMLDTLVVSTPTGRSVDTVLMGKQHSDAQPNAGQVIATTTTGSDLDGTNSQVYIVRLASGLFNTDKFLPLGFISGAGITLELQLEDPNTCLVDPSNDATSLDYIVSDVEFVGHIMEFSTEFEQAFGMMLQAPAGPGQGPVFFHGVTYRNYVYSVSNTSQFNIPVTERARSLKALLVSIRDQATVTNKGENSISRRFMHDLTSYQFKIGSFVFPQQPVTFDSEGASATGFRVSYAEALAEALKAYSALSDLRVAPEVLMQYNSVFGSQTSTWADPQAIIAIDLERFPGESGLKESGLNTAAQALAIEIDIKANNALKKLRADNSLTPASGDNFVATIRFDTFSMVDVMFRVDASGTISAYY